MRYLMPCQWGTLRERQRLRGGRRSCPCGPSLASSRAAGGVRRAHQQECCGGIGGCRPCCDKEYPSGCMRWLQVPGCLVGLSKDRGLHAGGERGWEGSARFFGVRTHFLKSGAGTGCMAGSAPPQALPSPSQRAALSQPLVVLTHYCFCCLRHARWTSSCPVTQSMSCP